MVGQFRSAFGRPLKADIVVDRVWAKRASLRDFARCHARWGFRRAYVDPRNHVWIIDIQFDLAIIGKPIKILSIVN